MGSHNTNYDMMRSVETGAGFINDPGELGTIVVRDDYHSFCSLNAAEGSFLAESAYFTIEFFETRYVAPPQLEHQTLTILMGVGSFVAINTFPTVIDQDGNTALTLYTTGDLIRLRAVRIGSDLRWTVDYRQQKYTGKKVQNIPLTAMRVHDSPAVNLAATAADDDMGLATGSPPQLIGEDFGGGTIDSKCRFFWPLPDDYVPGTDIAVRIHSNMTTTVSDGTATLDVAAAAISDSSQSADICETDAQDINMLGAATYVFDLDGSLVVNGDLLNVLLSFGGSDAGNAGVMVPVISQVAMHYLAK